jgi:hypothetical protein
MCSKFEKKLNDGIDQPSEANSQSVGESNGVAHAVMLGFQ